MQVEPQSHKIKSDTGDRKGMFFCFFFVFFYQDMLLFACELNDWSSCLLEEVVHHHGPNVHFISFG